jgi:hypothetical protein
MRREIWKSVTEWRTSVFQRWWDMLNIPISAIPLILGIVNLILWSRKVNPPLPLWDLILVIGGALLFIAVSFWAFHQMRIQRDKLINESSTPKSEIKIMEWRQKYRKSQIAEITQVPDVLKSIWVLVEDILGEKKKSKYKKDKLLPVLADILDVEKDSKLFNPEYFKTRGGIKKAIKIFRANMNLKKSNLKLEAQYRMRIAKVMDEHKIGLMLKENSQYLALIKQLEDTSAPISKTKVYNKIDAFLDNLSALYSVRLLMLYGGSNKEIYMYPREVRDVLEHTEEGIEREVRSRYVQVKNVLEEYSIGEDMKDG